MPDAPPDALQDGSHPAGRAPLLWLAAPMLAGYVLGGLWPTVAAWKLFATAIPFLTFAGVLAWRAPPAGFGKWPGFPTWGMCLFFAATLVAWAWHNTVVRAPPDWAGLPPREETLSLRILRNFRQSPESDYTGGLAQIVGAPIRELEGQTVYFRIRVRDLVGPPRPGEILDAQGLLEFAETSALSQDATPPEISAARFTEYLHSQGAWFTFTRARITREAAPPGWWMSWLAAQNARIDTALRLGPAALSQKWGNIYVSILLGDPTLLTTEQRAAFVMSGTVHLFAISGLQVFILAGAVLWVWRRIPRLPYFVGDVLTLVILWLYTEITGGSPSARRAALMFTFYVFGTWLGRKRNALPAIVAAAVCTLTLDPLALGNAGFQLSYAVVFGLILYAAPLHEALKMRFLPWRDVPPASLAPWQKCWRWLWNSVCGMFVVSWTALVCAAALTSSHFGIFSAYGLFLNLLLVPLSVLVLWTGAAAVGLGIWGLPPFTWLAWLLNIIGLCGVGLMDHIARWTPPVPGMFLRLRVEPHWAGPLAAGAVLAVMFLGRSRLRHPRWWYYLLPLAVLAVYALAAVRPQ